MAKGRPGLLQTVVGLGFAAAGISKLLALEPQRQLFASWGWTEKDMRIMGAAELGGAAMLMTRPFTSIGAGLLAANSVCLALTEYRHHNDRLVTPRLGMLAAAVASGFIGRG
jgi:hypothetical protein